jgi:hypothetical protein
VNGVDKNVLQDGKSCLLTAIMAWKWEVATYLCKLGGKPLYTLEDKKGISSLEAASHDDYAPTELKEHMKD